MWTSVENSVNPHSDSGKDEELSVDKACGQMWVNSNRSDNYSRKFRVRRLIFDADFLTAFFPGFFGRNQ